MNKNSIRTHRTFSLLVAAGLSALPFFGCSSDDGDGSGATSASSGGESTAELCTANCSQLAAECPAGSNGAEAEALCELLCLGLKDTPECRSKYQALADCFSQEELDCDTADTADPTACEEEGEPFNIVVSSEGAEGGECVQLVE